MLEELDLSTVSAAVHPEKIDEIREFLARFDLEADPTIEVFVVARHYGTLLACAGIAGPTVRCVALDPSMQGQDLLSRLMLEVSFVALDRGHSHLFLYTRPRHEQAFTACGFHTVVTVPDQVVMMENTPRGIASYVESLRARRVEGSRIGGVVLNANPFTLGHRHLLATAAADCDVVHVFVVGEDASYFSFEQRLALVRAGVAEMPEADRIHVHPGTEYVVSRATFPTYFLKEQGVIDRAVTAVDLLIFRRYIAPALGITRRYVGTEPFCRVTRGYNEDMHRWLERDDLPYPVVQVVEIPRLEHGSAAISATEVRRRVVAGDLEGLADLVPGPTYELLTSSTPTGGA